MLFQEMVTMKGRWTLTEPGSLTERPQPCACADGVAGESEAAPAASVATAPPSRTKRHILAIDSSLHRRRSRTPFRLLEPVDTCFTAERDGRSWAAAEGYPLRVRKLSRPRSTNATALAELELTRVELEGLDDGFSSRALSVAFFETPDGDPVVGITYLCDHRAEEEWGVGNLAKALTGDDPRAFQMSRQAFRHIAFFSDRNGLILSTEPLPKQEYAWGEPVGQPEWMRGDAESYTDYARHFEQSLPWVQGINDHVNYWMTSAELREVGRKLGVEKLPRKKSELYDAVAAAARAKGEPKRPDSWPAWFHNGKQMILRADSGPAARVLARVARAAREGFLGVGNGSSNPFSQGLLFFDVRDETEGLRKAIKERHDWHDAQMKKLAPAERELKRLGYRWYFLGRPREVAWQGEEKALRFWVNGLQLGDPWRRETPIQADEEEQKLMRQARDLSGWFTIPELQERELRLGRIRERIAERAETKQRYAKS